MTTESEWTSHLLTKLRVAAVMKEAVVYKHNDWSTKGIPDFSISLAGHTSWWEVKRVGKFPTKIQYHYLKLLAPAAFVLTFNDETSTVMIERIRDANPVKVIRYDQLVQTVISYAVTLPFDLRERL